MTITIPENISEVTLGQFQTMDKFIKIEGVTEQQIKDKMLSVYLGIMPKDVQGITISDKERLIGLIQNALNSPVTFNDRFTINGVKFGMIPNFQKMLTKEYVDLSLYPPDKINTWHNLMAILFRPIDKEDALGNYSIVSYEGTEQYANIMKLMPMNIVDGAMVFFCNLARELRISTQKSLEGELRKARKRQTSLKNGVGTQR